MQTAVGFRAVVGFPLHISSTDQMARVFRVIPTTQQYDWGKKGRDSIVAQLAQAYQAHGLEIVDGSPYAEVRSLSTVKGLERP